MKQYEHKIVDVKNSLLESLIKQYESVGWEVAGITQNIGEYTYKVIFKRLKIDYYDYIRKEVRRVYKELQKKDSDKYRKFPTVPNEPIKEPSKYPWEFPFNTPIYC